METVARISLYQSPRGISLRPKAYFCRGEVYSFSYRHITNCAALLVEIAIGLHALSDEFHTANT